MRRIVLLATAILAIASPAQAQDKFLGAAWSVAQGVSDFGDYVDDVSFRGLAFDFRSFSGESRSLGVTVAWNVFVNKTTRVSDLPIDGDQGGSVAGTQFRWVNTFPVYVTVHQHFGIANRTRPYIGLGAGVIATQERLELGTHRFDRTRWLPAASPELGIITPLGRSLRGFLSLRFHYGVSLDRDEADVAYGAVHVGIAEF